MKAVRRTLTAGQMAERSINKRFRKELWNPLIAAVKRYALIRENDRILVLLEENAESFLMAKLFQTLHRHSEVPFDVDFVLDKGAVSRTSADTVTHLAETLDIPLHTVCGPADKTAAERLLWHARERRCSCAAAPDTLHSVIETLVQCMLSGNGIRGIPPKEWAGESVQIIRPLYCIRDTDIQAFCRHNALPLSLKEREEGQNTGFSRTEVRALLEQLKKTNPAVEDELFSAVHDVCLETMVAWTEKGQAKSFLDTYAF